MEVRFGSQRLSKMSRNSLRVEGLCMAFAIFYTLIFSHFWKLRKEEILKNWFESVIATDKNFKGDHIFQ